MLLTPRIIQICILKKKKYDNSEKAANKELCQWVTCGMFSCEK